MGTQQILFTLQYKIMHLQNQSSIQPFQQSPSKSIPIRATITKRKISQLQNKAYFFQGQLNPLLQQNEKLKSQLTNLTKITQASTQVLRQLLPIGNDPSKKLKLEMASIQEISDMIKQDWLMMVQQIQRKNFGLQVLQKKIVSNKAVYEQQFTQYKTRMQNILQEKQRQAQQLTSKKQQAKRALAQTKFKCEQQIQKIKQSFKLRVQRADKLQRQFEIFKHEVHRRYKDYDKSLQRMKDQIGRNLSQFQQSKKNLREIYDKLMNDKLAQQTQTFQMMLKTKQDQKDRLLAHFQQKQQEAILLIDQKNQQLKKYEEQYFIMKDKLQKERQENYKKQDQIKDLSRQIKTIGQEMYRFKSTQQATEKSLRQKENQLAQKENLYKNTLAQKQKQIKSLQSIMGDQIQQLSKDKKALTQNLKEKQDKLKTTMASLVTAQRKFNERLQQQKNKWESQKIKMKQSQQIIRSKLAQKQIQLKGKEQQMIKVKNEHQEKLKNMLESQSEQIKKLAVEHASKLENVQRDYQLQMFDIKNNHQRELTNIKVRNNQQLKQMMIECNKKLILKQNQFKTQIKSFQEQITLKDQELRQKQLQKQKLSQRCSDYQQKIQDQKIEVQKKIRQLNRQNQNKLKQITTKLQRQKKQLNDEMINQLLTFQQEMEEKQQAYNSNLDKIKSELLNEINVLKSSNALQSLQQRYQNQMKQLKNSFQEKISHIKEQNEEGQKQLIEEQQRKIEELIVKYQEDMLQLAQKLESDMSKLNEQLIGEQHQHQITKMTRQQKIGYLSKKIHNLKTDIEGKSLKILQLDLIIQRMKKQIEQIDSIIEQKLKLKRQEIQQEKQMVVKQCKNRIETFNSQCKRKVTQIQRDRLEHTQNMYLKFNQLKDFHDQEITRLQNKYIQLETLFAQRPSRAEDLSKIKELTDLRDKLDMQISSFHQKVQHANQIVKYLNLQLQNYKDVYDIFGPENSDFEREKYNQKERLNTIQDQSPLSKFINIAKKKIKNTETEQVYTSLQENSLLSPLQNRKLSQSPDIKQFRLFPHLGRHQSTHLMEQDDQQIYSNLKSPNLREKRIQNKLAADRVDRSGQIMSNAQNFLSLIKGNRNNRNPVIQEQSMVSLQKRAYRRSRPRRTNTISIAHHDKYLIRRKKHLNTQT